MQKLIPSLSSCPVDNLIKYVQKISTNFFFIIGFIWSDYKDIIYPNIKITPNKIVALFEINAKFVVIYYSGLFKMSVNRIKVFMI